MLSLRFGVGKEGTVACSYPAVDFQRKGWFLIWAWPIDNKPTADAFVAILSNLNDTAVGVLATNGKFTKELEPELVWFATWTKEGI